MGEQDYNPLQIPCDWNVARKHGLARRTAPDTRDDEDEKKPEACPCCGFEIERYEIPYCDSPQSLKFLGSGFPLFYNYLKFCILLLGFQSIVGVLNLIGNINGSYCQTKQYNEETKSVEYVCQQSFLLNISLANKLDNEFQIIMIQKMNFILISVIMVMLIVFRREQKKLDALIDESQLTPADYTILVTNIPRTLPVNYKWELTNLFQNYACVETNLEIIVRKVVLVYDTKDLEEIEDKIQEVVEKKKQALRRSKMNFSNHEVLECNMEIEQLYEKLENLEEEYLHTSKRFVGTAFVSFESEDMKDAILKDNPHSFIDRIRSYLYHGKAPILNDDVLQWHQQQIFVEEAPEPNDVDWEFIHIQTTDKIIARIKAFCLTCLLQLGTFLVIYMISFHLIELTDKLHEEQLKGKVDSSTTLKVRLMSYGINLGIVLFNKFSVGYILHKITDTEKISTKTKFQISFAKKLTLSLFMNAALISYIIDILIFQNLYGFGGFIFNETLIFILNAILPPFIWWADPWTLYKNYVRDREIEKGTDSLLTQEEANVMMEQVDYLSGKRYSDIIKTMWFTFFFGTAIPIGVFSSFFGLILYYAIDKYNILRRRTVKESISKELSLEMISMLELIVIFGPLGCLTVSYSFYQRFETLDIIQLIAAIIYTLTPFDAVIDSVFPISNREEPVSYEVGSVDFDTDYDRENPITKKKAIKEFQLLIEYNRQQQKEKQQRQTDDHDL